MDRILKMLVQGYFVPGESIAIIPKGFYLTYVLNPGAAFGLMAGHTWIFIITACLVIGAILYIQRNWAPRGIFIRLALGMIGGGALGNLFDRVTLGKVVDYLDFRVWPYIFNFADAMIVMGTAIMAVILLRKERQERKEHEYQ